jgi:hypothetical protein
MAVVELSVELVAVCVAFISIDYQFYAVSVDTADQLPAVPIDAVSV